MDLKGFMAGSCSLVNKDNHCKCSKKTKSAIEKGYVDAKALKFTDKHYNKVKDVVRKNETSIQDIMTIRIEDLFREHPYHIFESKTFSALMQSI